MPTPRIPLLALLCLAFASLAAAELRLPAVFSDHMVLQREKPVAVWGWADADEEVSVEFAGQKKTAQADTTGRWSLRLDPLNASTESRKLIATGKDGRKAEISDVLVGDVWLGSGQSNMAMTVNRAKDFEQEKTAATFPLIRHFKEESAGAATAQTQSKGKWLACTPDNVSGFSATLYFFGRELHPTLSVPVGLIIDDEDAHREGTECGTRRLRAKCQKQGRAACATPPGPASTWQFPWLCLQKLPTEFDRR